jgi:hypothetical protein
VAGRQARAQVAVAGLAGVEDLAMPRGRPRRGSVADVQPAAALGVVEQPSEQIIDPLTRRRGEATVEVAVRRFGSASTRRSGWSMRSASRSGVRLIPSSSASATCDIVLLFETEISIDLYIFV